MNSDEQFNLQMCKGHECLFYFSLLDHNGPTVDGWLPDTSNKKCIAGIVAAVSDHRQTGGTVLACPR